MNDSPAFLPMSLGEARARGWDELDVVLVTGDAYVDHPAFGAAVIGRVLEAAGYRVGVIAQPDWRSVDDFRRLGKPRLFWGVTAGAMDSMVNRFTSARKPRRRDAYSPGGATGRRPDRAAIVYANRCREAFSGVPVVLGGVEASLRRFAHYDYWSDKIRRSILLDAKADLLAYGMGERQAVEIARRLDAGESVAALRRLPGVLARFAADERPADAVELPAYDELRGHPDLLADATRLHYMASWPGAAAPVVQRHEREWVIENPAPPPMTSEELDAVYALPFTRRAHPAYDAAGGVPALESVKFSVVTHRGCFGGCSFCAIGLHQGRSIQSRSIQSILDEIRSFESHPDYRGVVFDLGGPTANMYGMRCRMEGKWPAGRSCRRASCLHPDVCPNLDASHDALRRLLARVRRLPGVRRAFVASGVRHDLALRDDAYVRDLVRHHVGGHLKLAPEHVCDEVLRRMAKPRFEVFLTFLDAFQAHSRAAGKEQYVTPYLMSGHPGCTMSHMRELADFFAARRWRVEQGQDFLPTPMSASTAMFVSGRCPFTGERMYVARSLREKAAQRRLLPSPPGRPGKPRGRRK